MRHSVFKIIKIVLLIPLAIGCSGKSEWEDGEDNSTISNTLNDLKDDAFLIASIPQDIEINCKIYKSTTRRDSDFTIDYDDKDYLLTTMIRPEDETNFKLDYPDQNYVVYAGVYSYYTNNRIPIYSLKSFPNLEYIFADIPSFKQAYQLVII